MMVMKLNGLNAAVLVLALFGFGVSSSVNSAPIDSLSFDTQAEEDRFKLLIEEIRCVKCQNTSIAGSNADLARDHRNKVYEMLKQGKTDDEIREWFVVRYGDFVLYRPQMDSRTWLLWGLPLILVVAGILLLIMRLRSRSKDVEQSSIDNLSVEDQHKLDEVLK